MGAATASSAPGTAARPAGTSCASAAAASADDAPLLRACLDYRTLVRGKPRCIDCQRRHDLAKSRAKAARRPDLHADAHERERRRRVVADHRAMVGDWCPGWERRLAHRSADLTADHVREVARGRPDGPLVAWREHSAAGYETTRWTAPTAGSWQPGPGDFLARDGLEACLPPKMREASFRRARLCQLTDQFQNAWLPPSAWAACSDATRSIPDGAEVALAFDGSFNGDTTVLVVATVDQRPHIDLVELWEPGGGQVPIVDVENAIRAACRRWPVLEIAADPFRWARSLQLLDGEGCRCWSIRSRPGG